MRGLTESAEIGKSTIYQEVCLSHYRFSYLKKLQFSSLLGAVVFLYFAGNLWVVAFGMIVLVMVVFGSESLVLSLTSNPLLSALWGGAAANAVAQMGVAPRVNLFYFLRYPLVLLLYALVQSEFFAKLLQGYSAFINEKSQIK